MPHKPGIGAIFGVVSEDGLAKPNFPVTLVDRTTGAKVSRQYTDANGGFVFTGLDTETDDYQVIAQDEDNPPYKNAVIRDRIKPVPAYQGANYPGNWRWVALQKQCQSYYDGSVRPDGYAFSPHPSNAAPILFYASGSLSAEVATFSPSITPGCPTIPSIDMQGKKYLAGSMPQAEPPLGVLGFNKDPTEVSVEFAAQLNTWHGLGDANYPCDIYVGISEATRRITGGTSVLTTVINIRYQPDTDTIRVWRNNGSGFYSVLGNNLLECTPTPIDVSSYSSAPHHYVFSLKYGLELVMYVDGVAVATIDLVGTNSTFARYNTNDYGRLSYVLLASSQGTSLPSNARGVVGQAALLAVYASALTASDVQDLYQAAMTETTPLLTGYAKDVFIDRPHIYIRLNEPQGSLKASDVFRPNSYFDGLVAGSVTFGGPCLVAGSTGAVFNGSGGIRFDFNGFNQYNPHGLSIEWLAKPTYAAPAGIETLYQVTNTSESFVCISLQRLTDARLQLKITSNSVETLTFNTLMDDVVDEHHYAIVVDKTSQEAKLYVDGSLIETVALDPIPLSLIVEDPAPTHKLQSMLGGIVADNGSVSAGYSGALSNVAVYNYSLPVARIQSHVAALSVP